ncbi:hypothetical protein GW17_00003112 [Ensete ventricosum]|nr:hypothetical protein GW17_00003112 [Ensete ventricosum]
MAMKGNAADNRTRSSVSIFIIISMCCFFYILGAWQKSGFGKGDSIAIEITKQTDCTILPNLSFETHHSRSDIADDIGAEVRTFEPCHERYRDYTPCQDQNRAMLFPRENMNYRERHCPPEEEKLYCLVPAPEGYVAPFPWPKSRDFVPYANVPYKSLTVEKAVQNWVQYEGNVFRFPGGGTQFPQGADTYIDQLASVIPIANGTVRTALDTGCGVASWGAYLLKRNVLAMSFAPRDSHEAQVQFALERGVPAIIDGMYMMEVDRVLRPGGYWVLSGPPINWKNNYKAWQRTEEDLEEEQKRIEEIAELLCWEKVSEKSEIAIWRKRINSDSCAMRQDEPRLGSFAAAIESPKLWVMNVVPTIADKSTLGVIYERGLIGIYHDWCKMEDILLEMDRILRPEGAVIFRDQIDILMKAKRMITGMRWNTKMVDHEDGPLLQEKVLVAVKQYWAGGHTNETAEV